MFVLFVLTCLGVLRVIVCGFVFVFCWCKVLFAVWLVVRVTSLSDDLVSFCLVHPLIVVLLLECSIDLNCVCCFSLTCR